ncbi:MAG: sulfotransferase [Acidobacteria bacterium]|nr:sulfotransferase [Acidobacteriota bacterium]
MLGIARLLMKRILISRLNTRRTILKFYQANKPFIESRGRLRAPLIITGCPRTGSTLLQRLMAEDPNARSPFTFEMESPLPPMIEGTDPLADPRIAQANDALKVLARTAPGFLEKFSEWHLWNATEYEESYIYMLGHNGLSVMDAPNAGEVFLRAFTELAYHGPVLRYERLFFTLLDAYRPASSHWILKAPNYAFAFPFVIQEYPDARVVITHRNPFISLPSVCRLLESWCIAFTRDRCFDKHRFAKLASMLFTPCFAVPFQFRRANPDKTQQIFDCMYDELFADPIGMVKRIYRFFDLDVTPGFEQRMHRYLHNNRQGKYGRHAYSLAEYAIDPEAFLENHRDYMSHYGFKLEGVVNRKRAGSLQI